jgi:hypothetical protein
MSPLPFSALTVVDICSSFQEVPTCVTDSVAKPNSDTVGPIRFNQMEVTVHTRSEQHPDLYISKGRQLYEDAQGPMLDDDVENGKVR